MNLLRVVIAILAAVALLIVGLRLSAPYRHERELRRNLPFFDRVVSRIQSDPSLLSGSMTKLASEGGVYSIVGQQRAPGEFAIEFLTGAGFPVKHRGFLFVSVGRPDDFPDISTRWSRKTPIREKWFYIAD